jgi:hypothetical protein
LLPSPGVPNATGQLPLPLGPSDAPAEVFERVFRRLGVGRTAPRFEVEFRAFAGLRSQILLRDGQVRARISDLLASAPAIVLEALAEILLSQLYRRRASREAQECYLAWVCQPAVRRRVDQARRERGRIHLLSPRGKHFDLEVIFSRLNRRFFDGDLALCRIGWSTRASRTVLGRYDPAHRTIVISKTLDSPSVPSYVLDYLVFHEMLHARFPMGHHGSRRVIHSREFRAIEKTFPHYDQARARLKSAFS